MDSERLIRLARRWWVPLAAVVVGGALLGYYLASQSVPQYEARTRVLVGPLSGTVDTLRASGSLAATYRDLATSTSVLQATSDRLGLPGGADALRGAVRSVADTDTRLIDITVRYADPQTAADVANIVASELQRLQAAGGQVTPEAQMTVVDRAEPPSLPIGLLPILPSLLGAIAGLVAVALVILMYEYRSDRIRAPADISDQLDVQMLGSVAAIRQRPKDSVTPLLVHALSETSSAATYRTLASKALLAPGWEPARTLVVVEPEPGSGAGEVAANLAAVYAGLGRRSFLLDASGLDREIIVTGSTENELRMDSLLFAWTSASPPSQGIEIEPGLWMGILRDADLVGISKDAAHRVITRLADNAETVVVNAGPLLLSASSLAWAAVASRTLVVARRDVTKRKDLVSALESLAQVHAEILGVLLVAGTVSLPRGRQGMLEAPKVPERRGRRPGRVST